VTEGNIALVCAAGDLANLDGGCTSIVVSHVTEPLLASGGLGNNVHGTGHVALPHGVGVARELPSAVVVANTLVSNVEPTTVECEGVNAHQATGISVVFNLLSAGEASNGLHSETESVGLSAGRSGSFLSNLLEEITMPFLSSLEQLGLNFGEESLGGVGRLPSSENCSCSCVEEITEAFIAVALALRAPKLVKTVHTLTRSNTLLAHGVNPHNRGGILVKGRGNGSLEVAHRYNIVGPVQQCCVSHIGFLRVLCGNIHDEKVCNGEAARYADAEKGNCPRVGDFRLDILEFLLNQGDAVHGYRGSCHCNTPQVGCITPPT